MFAGLSTPIVKKRLMPLAAMAAGGAVLLPALALQGRNAPEAAEAPTIARSSLGEFPAPPEFPAEIPVALLVDLSSGQTLFAREPERRFMPASVTKVMTAYTAFKLLDEGALTAQTIVPIGKKLEREWSGEGSSMFLRAGQTPTVDELLMGTTTVSGNDATVALAIAATGSVAGWTELMNVNAAELGMSDSHFYSPNGFPDEGRTYTNARDLAILAEAITTRYPELYTRYFGHRRFTWQGVTQANHDPITGQVDGADGLKTGFTNEAGYTFVGSAERDGRRLVMVLGGAPTSGIRNKAARELIAWGFDAFHARPLVPTGALLGAALVQDGRTDRVLLRAPTAITASIPRLQNSAGDPEIAPEVSLSIRYRGPVEAPIEEGERIAFLRIAVEGQSPHEVPLEAAEPVQKANAWYRLVNGLYGMFD